MPTKSLTLADLAAQASEIERQKAALQLPVLESISARLAQPEVAALLADLQAAQAAVVDEHAAQLGYLITTLTNVPQHIAGVVTTLGNIVNPPVMPAPSETPAPAA